MEEGAMKRKRSEVAAREGGAPSGAAKQAHEAKTPNQRDAEAVARAVLEALSAHDAM
jgi:hypothetical protein